MMMIPSKERDWRRTSARPVAWLCAVILTCATLGVVRAVQETVFEDWVRQCEEQDEFAGRCFIRQTLTLKSSGEKLFEIAAGYPLGGQYPMLLLSIPLGAFLPPGIVLEVDETESFRAIVAYCNADGCHAYYRMTPEFFNYFRNGRWLNVRFQDGTRRTHRLAVSLNGFSAAIDSLETE